jgi:hypothetical protein
MISIPDLVPFRHWVSRGVFLVVPGFRVGCAVWCDVVWALNFNRMGKYGRVDRWTPAERGENGEWESLLVFCFLEQQPSPARSSVESFE